MIAYYVHHHGSGHVRRAATIAAHASSPVLGLSSLPAPDGWAGPWIRLPLDDGGGVDHEARDVTAGATLHWAPTQHDGLRRRMNLISGALVDHAVDLLVADVSVEVALLARLHGVPVVVMAQPGERTDRPHRAAFDLATRLLAPWPATSESDWPPHWLSKTVHLGALSRFDGRVPAPARPGRRVLALWGAGGVDVGTDDLQAAAAHTPDWTWEVVGLSPPDRTGPPNLHWRGWLDDVWPALCDATVVVTHAGQNALAEVAAARRPAVVLPQDRPHDEQHASARTLRRAGIGIVRPRWPAAPEWPGVLEDAVSLGGDGWSRWSSGQGAARAAAELDGLAGAHCAGAHSG